MRKLATILVLVAGMRAMAAGDGDERNAPVLVCLNPGANARIAHSAEAAASHIFASIGVDLEWQSNVRYCVGDKSAVLITLGEPAPDGNSTTLAYASPYEGSHVVVYFTRLRDSVSPQGVSPLLAHVMVHEIAHILQGVVQHSSEGMMKQKWTTRDIVDLKWRPLPFGASDILLIRLGLRRRNAIALTQAR
jgi:hypothetical protein